jgi:phenylacetate-CoA ligase
MADTRASVLCCTPTYALHLAVVRDHLGFEASRLNVQTLIVAGEAGGSLPAVRERLTRLWNGARVVDHHGMTEVGPVSYECPAEPGVLHVMESSYLAEVVEPDSDAPVAPGATGELVLTTLDRIASPLLRYRTGDIVCADRREPCACGSHEMRLLGGIRGRTDEMITIRGVNVFPSAVDDIVRSVDGVVEYEVEIQSKDTMQELRLSVEVNPDHPTADRVPKMIEQKFRSVLSLRVPVRRAMPGTLPRYEMKARRWKHSGEGHE